MKKIIFTTIIAVAATIILLSAVAKSQIQAEQPERMQPTITTVAVTTALEAKEKNDNGACDNENHNERYNNCSTPHDNSNHNCNRNNLRENKHNNSTNNPLSNLRKPLPQHDRQSRL